MEKLTIIIVSWNCRAELDQCLRSIEGSKSKIDYRIVVVDNNSSDGTVEFLRAHRTDVRVIANTENRGFAAANNQAFESVHGDYVLLLNPDTLVHEGTLDALVAFMDAHQAAGAAGPVMRKVDGSLQHTGVRFPDNWDIFVESLFLDRVFPHSRIFGRHRNISSEESPAHEVDFVQGSCMIVRSEIISRVGGLDERFFLYFEEVDWCWRIRHAGYRVYLCRSAAITHFANAEVGHYDERRLVYYHQSLLKFYRKHYPFPHLLVLRCILVFRSLARIGVWAAVALLRPPRRARARSSMKGYVRTLSLLVREKEYPNE